MLAHGAPRHRCNAFIKNFCRLLCSLAFVELPIFFYCKAVNLILFLDCFSLQETDMSVEIKIFPSGFPKKFAEKNKREIPVVADYSVRERMKTLYSPTSHRLQPISRALIGGKITHTVTKHEIARKFGQYFRSSDKESLFSRNDSSFIFTQLFGNDSFETCTPDTNVNLRLFFISYLQSKNEMELISLWHSFLADAVESWRPGGNLVLTEVIPLFVCRIGAGILGFKESDKNIERISKAITMLTQSKAQGSGLSKNLNATARDGWNTWIVTSLVRKKLAASLQEIEQNPQLPQNSLFFNMAYYFEIKNLHQIAPSAIDNTLEALTHNYLFLLFAFQVTTSSVLIHLLWELSKDPVAQEKYREIACKAKLSLNSIDETNEECYKNYFEQLTPFNALVAEGFRLYSPVGFVRQLQYDALLKYDDGEGYPLCKGDLVEYWPYAAGQDHENFHSPAQFNETRFCPITHGSGEEGEKFNAHHFGIGRNDCPASFHIFGAIKVTLAYLLRECSFSTTQQTINLNMQHTLNSDEPVIIKIEQKKDMVQKEEKSDNTLS